MVNGLIKSTNIILNKKSVNKKIVNIDSRLLNDADQNICVICEYKLKTPYRCLGLYEFADEIVIGKSGKLTSCYAAHRWDCKEFTRIGYKNVKHALNAIKSGKYDKFNSVCIIKINFKRWDNVLVK